MKCIAQRKLKFEKEHPELPALDTKGNKLPVGEYEVELVWQYAKDVKPPYVLWCNALKSDYIDFKSFSEFDKYYKTELAYKFETRQIYIASVAPESKEVKDEDDGMDQLAEKEWMGCIRNGHDKSGKDDYVNGYMDGYTAALSVNNQPENDDTIEQDGYKKSVQYSYGLIDGIAEERKRIRDTHVPIEEVISIIKKYTNPVGDLIILSSALIKFIEEIKPQ